MSFRRSLPLLAALVACGTPDPEPGDDAGVDETPIPAGAWRGHVFPMHGTAGDGAEIANVNPGATRPWGMTLVGPDTRLDFGAPEFYHCAGYWYGDDLLRGFSHTHAHGMGVPDYGAVPFLPRNGWDPRYTYEHERMVPLLREGPGAREEARPGFYALAVPDDGWEAELTATVRGGHTRVRFEEGAEPVLVFDLGQAMPGTTIEEGWIQWTPGSNEVVGYHEPNGAYSRRFGGLQTHFAALLEPAPIGGGAWTDRDAPVDGLTEAEGPTAGAWLTFPEGTTEVHLRLAISYVDLDGARANRDAELPDLDFDARVAEAEAAWDGVLDRVRVRGGTPEQQDIFYTSLYRAAIMPSRQEDVDGRYRGFDDAIHTTDHPYYSDLSLWDTFRTLHPWYLLAWPEVQADVNRSILRMVEDGGTLPKWPLAHGYTGGMVGSPAIQVLSESWFKGVRAVDDDAAFDAALAVATKPMPRAGRADVEGYLERGYVASDVSGGATSRTLEYVWSDHALGRWGEALGRPEAASLTAQANRWDTLWNADAGYFTGRRADGVFDWEDEPLGWFGYFVEGNAWHYLWYVPWDVDGLIQVQHGGDAEAFHARYAEYWEGVYAEEDDKLPDDLYWHGNEPVLHVPFLGSLSGRPDLTAEASRHVMATRYAAGPVGLDGNDDAGTLSAWYLWAALGLYPIAGTPDYAVGSPIFDRVEVDRPEGTWAVNAFAPGSSVTDAPYVARLHAGDTELPIGRVEHDAILAGDLVFEMRADP